MKNTVKIEETFNCINYITCVYIIGAGKIISRTIVYQDDEELGSALVHLLAPIGLIYNRVS